VGDRANFVFVQPGGNTIVLYGHWAGHNMLANLAEAIAKAQPRWNDPSYATRIAISNMIGDSWTFETGWGLQVNTISDNEHKIPVIDWEQMTFVQQRCGYQAFAQSLSKAALLNSFRLC